MHDDKEIKDFLLLGQKYLQRKEYDKAIEEFNKAIKKNPEISKAYSLIGTLYLRKGKYDEAIEKLNEAIKINQEDSLAYASLGLVYYEKEEYYNAIKYLKKVIELKPNDKVSYNLLGKSYILLGTEYATKNKNDKAIEYLKEAKKIISNDIDIYLLLSVLYIDDGKNDAAIEELTIAKKLDARNWIVYGIFGETYIKERKYDKAIEYLKEAIKLSLDNNDNIECYNLLAEAYFEKKDYDNSFDTLLRSKNKLISELKYSFEKKTNKNINAEYKEILLKIYFLHDSLKIKDVNSFKKENNKISYLYQYRKFDFLEIILKNKNFWLNPTDYQNDPNEGNVFFKYLGVENDKEINTDLVAFISCFSALEDNLVMWNSSYAEEGKGISIGVNLEKLSEGTGLLAGINIMSFSKGKNIEKSSIPKKDMEETDEKESISMKEIGLYKILYINLNEKKAKNNDKNKKIKDLLKDIKRLYKNITKDNFYKNGSKELKQNIDNWLNELFTLVRYLIKFDDYEHEKEYRLLYIDNIRKNKYVKSQTLLDGIHIETEKVLFKSEEKKDIIFVGPKSNNKFNMLRINHHLKSNDIDKFIEVKSSSIEFR